MGLRHFGVGEETTWGTAVARTKFFEALSESVKYEKEFEPITVIRSPYVRDMTLLNAAVRGDVEILANYDGLELLFKHLIGSTDTTSSGVMVQHTYPASTGRPSAGREGFGLTGEFRRDGSYVWLYEGMKITGMSHSFGTDQSSRVTFTFLAETESTSSSATAASYDTLLPMRPSEVEVAFDGTTLSAMSCQVNYETPVDEPFLLGSTGLGAEPVQNDVIKVTGNVEVLFDSWTQYNKFSTEADVDVAIVASSTDTTHSLTYNMNKCRITQATPPVQGRERLKATYEFESFYDTDATGNFQVVLLTTNAS